MTTLRAAPVRTGGPVLDADRGRVSDRRACSDAPGSRRWWWRLSGSEGLTSLEMSIIFPGVLLVIMSMFQISLYWHTSNAVGVAAEQAVDAGQVHPDDLARAQTEAEAAANWILDSTTSLLNPSVTVTINGDLMTVTVAADSPRVVGIGTWRVESVAQGRFEEFVPATER